MSANVGCTFDQLNIKTINVGHILVNVILINGQEDVNEQ